jgi:glycosyltransferase involved in cell wall biosynthesis
MMMEPLLTIVVPCYNEEEVLPETTKQLLEVLRELKAERLISKSSNILFVDDGSRDQTWKIISSLNEEYREIEGLKLSRNCGHQNALMAGLHSAKQWADCVISIDADLQDDLSVLREFVIRFREGVDIVYGVRKERKTDTLFKRSTAVGFYKFMNRIGIKIIQNHADFRLMSKRALEELSKYKEANLFLRGIVPLLGYSSTKVYYDRKERLAGESKYPLKKMISFAFDGITSFSIAPIRMVTLIGFISFIVSLFAGGYGIWSKLSGHAELGWASLLVSIWLIGGIQLMGIGLIGEYIGKIFNEVKSRPAYTIEKDTTSLKNIEHSLVKSGQS